MNETRNPAPAIWHRRTAFIALIPTALLLLVGISGAAYGFDAHVSLPAIAQTTGVRSVTTDPWTEQKVIASNGIGHDAFGHDIALRGTTALIGAVDVNNWEGAIYVFSQSDDGVWNEGQEFMADDGVYGDQATFGSAIAIDGTTAVIGALGASIDGHVSQGAAYVFTESDGSWTQVAKLVAPDGDANNYFGQTVAISGANVLVGAYGASVDGNALQGAAYVFTDADGTWTLAQKLTADDGIGGEFFGHAVALSGTHALIGAPYASIDGTPSQGAVYVFDGFGSSWVQKQKLVAADGAVGDGFGYSIAASASRFIAGAGGHDGGQGSTYVFVDADGTWEQDAELLADDGVAGDDFGYAVAILDDVAMVGADRAGIDGHFQQGAAYVFSAADGGWMQTRKLVASDGAENEFYGDFVALSDAAALVGVPYATVDGNAVQGAAYFYARTNDTIFRSDFDTVP